MNDNDVYKIEWTELKQYYQDDYSFGYLFIRSNEPDYDFIVYAKGEGRGNYLGIMKINIAKKIIKKELFYGKKIAEPDYPTMQVSFNKSTYVLRVSNCIFSIILLNMSRKLMIIFSLKKASKI